ncbi:MAG: matrixin family metalloprotease [Gammaproteobacteria bacterium]|nr:matrixin family metalloprotease [Gammaproteobacteria bacterium]
MHDQPDIPWDYCERKDGIWKISLSEPVLDPGIPQSLLSGAGADAIVNAVNINFASLSNGALGSTTGTTITLDDNAAGHGWYIDYTPYLNEEYLPTADANVWKAKPGSEAEGKMDMLSVLLHEYGHVLGIEHSADRHASMAATLQPGVRRLPTADELALMAYLVGEVKSGLTGTPENPPHPRPCRWVRPWADSGR